MMLRFKRAALAACALLAASSVSLAQGGPNPHRDKGGGRQGEREPAAKRDIAALVKALAEAMQSERTQTRLYAALALSVIEPKRADALEVLRGIVRDRREYYLVRRHAAFALARTAAGVRALAAMLRDEDDEVRLSSAFAFEDLSEGSSDDPAGPHAELRRARPAIVEALRAERNGVVQTVLGETLGQLGPGVKPDPDEEKRDAEESGAEEAADESGQAAALTAEETREARNLALLFLARARLTGDLEFAAREMLVEDFAERLQRELVGGGNFPDDFFDKRLAEQARPEELSRFYWSLLNFGSAGRTHLRERKSVDDEKSTLAETFPPQVVRVIERSDALSAVVKKSWGLARAAEPEGVASPRAVRVSAEQPAVEAAPGGRNEESKQAESDVLIRSARELKAFADDASEAAKLLREHRAAHAETGTRAAGAKGEGKSEDSEDAAGRPAVTILGDSYYGFPAKTRLVCVDVTPAGGVATFHLDFVPVNGKLRLLTVTPQ